MRKLAAIFVLSFAAPTMANRSHVVGVTVGDLSANGQPLDGTFDVTFELYGSQSGPDLLFVEDVIGAPIVNGVLMHDLGSVLDEVPEAVLKRDQVFLEIFDFDGNSIAPRKPIRSRSEVAETAETLNGFTETDFTYYADPSGGLRLDFGNQFVIDSQGVSEHMIQTQAVTNGKIADGSVTRTKIGIGAVASENIADSSVDTNKILNSSIITADLAAGAVTTPNIFTSAVTTAKIANGAVTAQKLATNSVNSANLNTTLMSVYAQPAGCGSGLSLSSATCRTLVCAPDKHFNCAATTCTGTFPSSCAVTLVGKLMPSTY